MAHSTDIVSVYLSETMTHSTDLVTVYLSETMAHPTGIVTVYLNETTAHPRETVEVQQSKIMAHQTGIVTSLSIAGNSGGFTSTAGTRALLSSHCYQCVQYLPAQCCTANGFLTCAQMFMHVIAHGVCKDQGLELTKVTITIYFINPSGKLKLSFDRATKNISQ